MNSTMSGAMTGDLDILERDLQKQIRNTLAQFGWRATVTWSSINSPKGFPDIFAVRPIYPDGAYDDPAPTEAVAIECKREAEHCQNSAPKGIIAGVSPEQQRAWLELLARLPGVKFAGVVRPSDWYAGVLDEVLR